MLQISPMLVRIWLASTSLAEPLSLNGNFKQCDTVSISPNVPTLAIRYNREWDTDSLIQQSDYRRVEISRVGDALPFQILTVSQIFFVQFQDMNFDRIQDLAVVQDGNEDHAADTTSYFFYDPVQGRFQFAFRNSSHLIPDADDSTIWGDNIDGMPGTDQRLKYSNGKFKLIYYLVERDNEQDVVELVNDSLIVTERYQTTRLSEALWIDSTWQYNFGALRLTSVKRIIKLNRPPSRAEAQAGIVFHDWALYQSRDEFKYERNRIGKLVCTQTHNEVKEGHWKHTSVSSWLLPN